MPRFFASSKICANCGVVKADLTLKDRTCSCDVCGQAIDGIGTRTPPTIWNMKLTVCTRFRRTLNALEVDQTDEVKPQRTIDKDRREEAYPEIMIDLEERQLSQALVPRE